MPLVVGGSGGGGSNGGDHTVSNCSLKALTWSINALNSSKLKTNQDNDNCDVEGRGRDRGGREIEGCVEEEGVTATEETSKRKNATSMASIALTSPNTSQIRIFRRVASTRYTKAKRDQAT